MFNLRRSAPTQMLVPDFRSAHVITILNCSSQYASWEYRKMLQIKIQFVVLSLLNCMKGSIVSFWAGKTKCQNCLLWPAWKYTWKYINIIENTLLSLKIYYYRAKRKVLKPCAIFRVLGCCCMANAGRVKQSWPGRHICSMCYWVAFFILENLTSGAVTL